MWLVLSGGLLLSSFFAWLAVTVQSNLVLSGCSDPLCSLPRMVKD